jgi:protein-disulfide isomerase
VVGVAAAVAALAVAAVHWMGATAPAVSSPAAPKPAAVEPGGTSRGRPDAPVTLEVFSDFLCSHCADFAMNTEPAIISEFVEPGIVRLVYRQFPLQPFSAVIAEASECAADQHRFWAYHDLLFAKAMRDELRGADDVRSAAKEVGLDGPTFVACIKAGKARARVEADRADGERRGVTGTPTIFIGKRMIVGAQPISVFRDAINAARPR